MLIRRGLWTHRPSLRDQEGFDLVCNSREKPNRLLRVEIKGRWATDSGPPNIRDEQLSGFDYLISVRLNAGYYYSKAGKPDGVQRPELFVFPNSVVRRFFTKEPHPGTGRGGRFNYTLVPDLDIYREDAGLDRLAAELRVPELEAQASRIVASRKPRP